MFAFCFVTESGRKFSILINHVGDVGGGKEGVNGAGLLSSGSFCGIGIDGSDCMRLSLDEKEVNEFPLQLDSLGLSSVICRTSCEGLL